MTPLHAQARALAAAGVPVFPCAVDGKHPVTPHALYDATTDLERIDAWWSEADYNIGVCPESAGWCVVDLDPGGEPSWVALLREHGEHEPTYEIETPRGGRHLYFRGSLPASASKLGSHVDTRGRGSYVLVAPSTVQGKPYRVLHDRELAECPRWIEAGLATADRRAKAPDGELDTPASLARGRSLLRAAIGRGDVAVSGAGGNDRTYRLFAELRSLGISGEAALGLVLNEGWNDACKPPWSNDELGTIASNAERYAQNEAGAWNVGSVADSFGKTEAFRQAMKENQPRQSRYRMMSAADFDGEPEPTWIVPGLIPDDSVCLWIGPSQSFKSFLLLDVFLGVATGKETFGSVPEKGLVLYGAIEDLRNVGKTRRRAWQFSRGLQDDALDNFRACLVPFLGMPGDEEEWLKEISTWLADRKLALLAIDTAGKVLGGLNENDSTSVRLFGRFCDRLRETFGCSVVAIHHSGKDRERGARGSSAWLADFDSVIETQRPDAHQVAVEVVVRKHKNAADGARWTFKGRPIAGSLVFEPSSAEEFHKAKEASDFFAPTKVGRALAKREAHTRASALTSADLWHALGGELGDEKGVRTLEKLAKLKLRAYCEDDAGTLFWWYPKEGST